MINEDCFSKFPELATERLLLRAFTTNDAKDIQFIRNNDTVMQYMDSPRHTTVQDAVLFITANLDAYAKGNGLFWVITDRTTGAFMGDFSFWRIDRKNSRAEIGYTLKPEYWGKGYMKETMTALLHFGFNHMNLHSFEANVNPNNEASKALLKRMGFRQEAYFRENYFFNGAFLDSEIYCLLQADLLT